MSIPVGEIRPYPPDRNVPSPNHGNRTGRHISLIVLHATAGSDAGSEAWMANPDSNVSAHLHIRRDGSVTRMVSDTRRAWHAGRSSWPGIGDVNSESLGWEIGNDNAGEEYTAAQYETVAALLRHYLPQGIDRDNVVSHAMVAPGRKTDPLGWDWPRMWALVDGEPDPEPEPEMVDSRPWSPPPLSTFDPVAVLHSPASSVVAATAAEDEPAYAWLQRVVEWLADQPETGELAGALLRWAIRKAIGKLAAT